MHIRTHTRYQSGSPLPYAGMRRSRPHSGAMHSLYTMQLHYYTYALLYPITHIILVRDVVAGIGLGYRHDSILYLSSSLPPCSSGVEGAQLL